MSRTRDTRKHLNAWADFVSEVESGYESNIDDYTNDLTIRNLLEDHVASSTGREQDELKAKLLALDNRFREATQPDEHRLLAQVFEPLEGWWWSRLPRKIIGSFKATLPSPQQ